MEEYIRSKLIDFYRKENGKKYLSFRFKKLAPIIIFLRVLFKKIFDFYKYGNLLNLKKEKIFFKKVLTTHSSPLFKNLKGLDFNLNFGKIENLKIEKPV